jgi:hypothetical protein
LGPPLKKEYGVGAVSMPPCSISDPVGSSGQPELFEADNDCDAINCTDVLVKGTSMQVRTALTNFIPLDRKPRGQILWIASTSLSHERITYVDFRR